MSKREDEAVIEQPEVNANNDYFVPAKGKITLRNPILVMGKPIRKFEYDMDAIGWDLQDEIDIRYKDIVRNKEAYRGAVAKLEGLFWRLTGIACIVACNPQLSFDDFRQLKGRDMDKVSRIGESFVLAPEELLYPASDSDTSDDGIKKPSEQR